MRSPPIGFLPHVSAMGLMGTGGMINARVIANTVPFKPVPVINTHRHSLGIRPDLLWEDDRGLGQGINEGFHAFRISEQGKAMESFIALADGLFPTENGNVLDDSAALEQGVRTLETARDELLRDIPVFKAMYSSRDGAEMNTRWFARGGSFKKVFCDEDLSLIALEVVGKESLQIPAPLEGGSDAMSVISGAAAILASAKVLYRDL